MPKVGAPPKSPPTAKAAPAKTKAAPPKGKKKPEPNGRDVLYAEPEVRLCIKDQALTAEAAKKILGWHEETDEVKFGNEATLTDNEGKKVRLYNNTNNRPFVKALADTIAADILRGFFKFNGEALIIGRTGLTLSCQHRLTALVLASQAWEKDPGAYPFWGTTPPVIDCLLVMGVDESDEVVNTLDTGKPRSLSDVLYRSQYFASMPAKDREKASRIGAYAVRLLWKRTGADADAFAPRRTHSEMIDFIERHPLIIDCVKHIHEENEGGKITKYIEAGYAAGLMYLMAVCTSSYDKYRLGTPPVEGSLDTSMFDKASEFWTLLAGGAKELAAVRTTLGNIINQSGETEGEQGEASLDEKIALAIKAWNLFSGDNKLTEESLALQYHTDDDGVRHLAESPTIGGIDVGSGPAPDPVVEPEEVEQEKAAIKAENAATNGAAFKVGDEVLVNDEAGEWQGIIKKKGKAGMWDIVVGEGYDDAGKVFSAHANKLTRAS